MTERERWYRRLQAHKKVISFIAEHHLSRRIVLQNVSLLENFIEHYRAECQLAPGEAPTLQHCQQPTPGYCCQLVKRGALINMVLVPCVHQVAQTNAQLVKQKIWYYDFAPALLELDITDPKSIFVHHSRLSLLQQLANFDLTTDRRGIYLYGPSGAGKTYIFMAFAIYLVKKYLGTKKIAFINAAHLVAALRQNMGHDPAVKPTTNLMVTLKAADVLFIDDFGVNKLTNWVRDEVYYQLFNHYLANHKLLFLTSNFSLTEIKQLLVNSLPAGAIAQSQAERLMHRIMRLTKVVPIKKTKL